jgi:hypothetical protein
VKLKPLKKRLTSQGRTEAAALSVVVLAALQHRIEAIESASKTERSQHGVPCLPLAAALRAFCFFILVYLVSIYAK